MSSCLLLANSAFIFWSPVPVHLAQGQGSADVASGVAPSVCVPHWCQAGHGCTSLWRTLRAAGISYVYFLECHNVSKQLRASPSLGQTFCVQALPI